MTTFEIAITVLASIVCGGAVVIPQIFLLAEIRKLFRQVRHAAEIYFPENVNKAAAAEQPKGPLPTSVQVNEPLEWRENSETVYRD
jgi:hypothetical protein